MANADTGRHNLHVIEALSAPFEKGEALSIALGFNASIFKGSTGARNNIGSHGVIDHERTGNLWVDTTGVSAPIRSGVTHGSKINEHGNTGKVLKKDTGGHELDFATSLTSKAGIDDTLSGSLGLLLVCRAPQDVFEQNAQTNRKAISAGDIQHARIRDGFAPAGKLIARITDAHPLFAHIQPSFVVGG